MLSSEHTNDGPPRGDFAKEIRQMYRILADLDRFERRAWIAGTALWSMHDYGTDADGIWPIQKSGIFDAWRLPKPSVHAIRAFWSAEPFIRILGHWNHTGVPGGDPYDDMRLPGNLSYVELTGPPPAGMREVFDNFLRRAKPVPVLVESNAPEVELFLDDRSLGRRSAADGYYWFVDYAPGTLRAVGTWPDGRTSADEIATAGYYDDRGAVVVEALHDTLRTNGVDVTLVTAQIVDQDGRFAPTAAVPVSFRVELGGFPGGAHVCGVGGVPGFVTVAGVGRIAVRAGTRPGRLRIIAEGAALRQGEAWVDLREE
jgi:beta-galactosidase